MHKPWEEKSIKSVETLKLKPKPEDQIWKRKNLHEYFFFTKCELKQGLCLLQMQASDSYLIIELYKKRVSLEDTLKQKLSLLIASKTTQKEPKPKII